MPQDVKKRLVELVGGYVCDGDVYDIVTRVQEYDPALRIQYLAGRGEPGNPPYRLVERCRDGIERIVFDIWELDARVLERIWAADNQRHDILAELDSNNSNVRAAMQKRFQDEEMAAALDLSHHVLGTSKGRYTIPGPLDGTVVKMHDDRPAQIIELKSGRELRK